MNSFGNAVAVTVNEAQLSQKQQPQIPRGPPLPETEKIRVNGGLGMGKKDPEIARNLSRSCIIIRKYFADPVNYGTQKSTSCKRALN